VTSFAKLTTNHGALFVNGSELYKTMEIRGRGITLRLWEREEMKKIIDTVNNALGGMSVVDGVDDFLHFFPLP